MTVSGFTDDSFRATAIAQALYLHTCFELQSIHYFKVRDGSTEEGILTLPEKISRWQSEWQKYDRAALVSNHLVWTLVKHFKLGTHRLQQTWCWAGECIGQ